MRLLKNIRAFYLRERTFYALAVIGTLFLFSYWLHVLFVIAWLCFLALSLLLFIDSILLFKTRKGIRAERLLPEKFSNSDDNAVPIIITNRYVMPVEVKIIDEIPVQFQKRDFSKELNIDAGEEERFTYYLKPVSRGIYEFGKLNVYIHTKIGLVSRRFSFETSKQVKVYPSFIQMKKYAFLAIDNKLTQNGIKKIRRIGHTMEFEQIKEYVTGDDIRTINWKATAKAGELMVNQFQDERSQPIYSLIDASRVMKMPFNNLSLLDYAINATLAFSNVALKKGDKTGLLTFSNTIHNHLPASSKKTYINTISEALYNINTQFLDSDFSRLYSQVKNKISHRSLLLLYTNFEHQSALQRQLPYLKALARKHILVVIFFENTEVSNLVNSSSQNIAEIYHKTVAQKMEYEKKLMLKELQRHGIQSILTTPEDLTVATINKYIEIKARGIL